MQATTGVFARRADAERAASTLEALAIPRDRITVLAPGADARRIPTDEGEAPGTGKALGAVVGGAAGVTVGVPIGAMMTLLVPGVGPVIASGLLGAALFGAGGAAVGAALEETLTNGLPRDERFVYEDALRRGHAVVLALVDDEDRAEAARRALAAAGAESIDAARERWWLGLRSAEQERYEDGPNAFARDEAVFRRGFEAALSGAAEGRDEDALLDDVRARCGADVDAAAFRRGWERGRRYRAKMAREQSLRKSA